MIRKSSLSEGRYCCQTRKILENIRAILKKAGVDFEDVVKTTYYITGVSQFPKVAALRSEYFKDVFSASTMVEVKGLLNKD